MIHKSVPAPGSYAHAVETKKSAKRLPCLYMVSSDTTYNLKQRMPRFSKKKPEPAVCGKYGCSGYFYTGLAILFLFFTDRHRIKINYGIILAQYLVSCQLNNTISSVFNPCFFTLKIYFTFFHIFSSIYSPVRYFFFRLTCYNSSSVSDIRSLITEEHTPSCIWVTMNGSLQKVCHPSGFNCTQCSQSTRPGRAQETVGEGMCNDQNFIIIFCKKLITNIFRYAILIARYCVFSYPG